MPKKAKKLGRLNLKEMRNLINKKAGIEIAHSLSEENPTNVRRWIPTGSRWLDSIICKGKLAGIPLGKVVEIAGQESTGKSYMAAQVAANAQRMGIDVVYFDSESAIDSAFLEKTGCCLDDDPPDGMGWFMYTQAHSVETVLETIEELLGTDQISGVKIKNFETKEIERLDCNEILFLFGLNKKLGPLENWNLKLNGKKISVDTEKYQTSIEGIYAVGDINDYPGKLDLILCGFHETTLAVQDAYRRCFPGERVPFGYTTSNTKLHKKLGVKVD